MTLEELGITQFHVSLLWGWKILEKSLVNTTIIRLKIGGSVRPSREQSEPVIWNTRAPMQCKFLHLCTHGYCLQSSIRKVPTAQHLLKPTHQLQIVTNGLAPLFLSSCCITSVTKQSNETPQTFHSMNPTKLDSASKVEDRNLNRDSCWSKEKDGCSYKRFQGQVPFTECRHHSISHAMSLACIHSSQRTTLPQGLQSCLTQLQFLQPIFHVRKK